MTRSIFLMLGAFAAGATMAGDAAEYESAAVHQAREARRAGLSARIGQLHERMGAATAGERMAWYRASRGRFFFEPDEIDARIDAINRLFPEEKTRIARAADRVLRHEFDLLGSGPTPLGDRIDWQWDFKSGVRWRNDVLYPAWNWHKVEDLAGEEIYRGHFYSPDGPSDLKVPWDLSALLHLPTLGEAFLLTGQGRYAEEAIRQLRDWHRENPYRRGVNWTCAMMAGIRLANMTCGLHLVERHPQQAAFQADVGLLSVLRHLKFILDALEINPDGRRNNHYLNNLVGLAFGGAELARDAAGRDLLDFVADELAQELSVQFLPDGTNFEGSIPYHRFATESAVVTAILLERNGRRMPSEAQEQLRRMMRFIDVYTKPNGLAPQIGDNDNGRILVLHDYGAQEYRDHRHILAVGAAWLGLGPLVTDVASQSSDAIWLLGRPGPTGQPAGKSAVAELYPHGGFAAAKRADASLAVRCGRLNPMSGGGHNHCDQLSLELHDRGQDLIVDPGAMVYGASGVLRNRFRATAAHNLLQLDDLEQQEFDPRNLFAMQDRARAAVDLWEAQGGAVLFRGHHSAYASAGWKVAREIRCDLDRGSCRVRDTVEASGAERRGREFCGRLHLAAGIEADQTAPHVLTLRAAKRQWTVSFSENLQTALREGQVSPSYGVATKAAVIEYRFPAAPGQTASFSVERREN